jgi:hypothetical protein
MSPFRSPQPRHQTTAPAINAVRLTPDSDSRAAIGCATKLRKPVRHFDENSAKLQVVGPLYAKEFGNLHALVGSHPTWRNSHLRDVKMADPPQ